MSASRSFSRSRSSEKTKRVVLITVGSLAVIGGFYALSKLGAKSYAIAERRATISKQQAEKLRTLAEQAEARWDEIKKKRAQTKTAYNEDDLAAIGEAAVARSQYETQVEGAESRYPALRKELHDLMGESLHKRSLALENAARAEENEARYAQAAELYKAALAVEGTISSDYPESSYSDTQRSVSLTGRMRLMTARPLWDASVADEAAGEAAFKRGDISGAIAAVGRAARTNYLLDREYQGLTRADGIRTRRLEKRLATLSSIPLRDHAEGLVAKAEQASASKNFSEVPALREAVEADADKLLTEFPESDFATPEITGELVRRVQNAAAAPDIEGLRKELAVFEDAVRKDGRDAARLLENLQRGVQRLREAYPKSDTLDKNTDERIGFLFRHRAEIVAVRASVNASLRPAPGLPALSVCRTETDQRIYSLVMEDNPSAGKGDNRPVESLTRREAARFCTRLGWMIAREVRLPTREEFLKIAGKPDPASLASTARAIDNSDGTPAPVPAAKPDANDLCDVLGNVGEWLAPSPGETAATAFVGGGNAENTLAQLGSVPVQSVPSTERSRFTGFRFVVENLPAR